MDIFKEWKRGDCQMKLWNGVHQEEGNEVHVNLRGRKGLEDWWEKNGLMEEDWNDRNNWRKNKSVKWAQEDVETSYNLLNK